MKESVVFLGTSHGDPSLSRYCSSTLYQIGDVNILIDAGEPVAASLIRKGLRPALLDAIFLTHMHVDHANGLSSLFGQILKYPDKKVEIFLSDETAIKPFLDWNMAMSNRKYDEKYVTIASVKEKFVWQKNNIVIRAIPTKHMLKVGAPSFAYLIETSQSKILHTGDLTSNLHDFPMLDEPCDLCICEATHARNNPEAFIEKLKNAPIRQLILNHIGPSWTDGQEDLLKELVSCLPYKTIIAYDNMEFVLHQ